MKLSYSTQVWHTIKTKQIYDMNNMMQCTIREREFRDSGSITNTKICFEVRATALRSRLHTEGFPLCPHRTFHKGISTEEL